MKTLSASTSSLLIGIIKHKFAAELVLHEVHLSAHHCHQCFAIDDHLEMVFADNFIEFASFFGIVHGIGKPVASFFSQTDFDADLGGNLWITIDGSFFRFKRAEILCSAEGV